jgi:hypothetical protein
MAVTLEGLVEYSDPQLEQMAHAYLGERVDVQFRVPVNVEALLEGCPNVDVDDVADIMKYTRTEGCVCRHMNGKDLKVFIDRDIIDSGPRADYLAVVAEELAHVVLHPAIFMQIKSFPQFLEVQRSPLYHRIERDAKRFSLAIRMPPKNLVCAAEKMYPEIASEHGFESIWAVQKLLRNSLADQYCVPQKDMHGRLMQWPCFVYDRVAATVLCKRDRLLSTEDAERIAPRKKQRDLF